jgi:hypothetical protein
MKHRTAFLWMVLLTLSPNFALLGANEADDQPHMRAAIGHLEAAKTAKEPLTSLRAARKALVNAKPNKEGQRKDAIGYVDEAIAFATTGDKAKMLEKISKAISNVKSGIARSR